MQEGRVRGLYLDINDGGPGPKRGDRLWSGKTLYYVLHSRKVKRKNPQAVPRFQMRVMQRQDMPEGLSGRLLQSAMRRGGSLRFEFQWYPREKKRKTFEEYMRRAEI